MKRHTMIYFNNSQDGPVSYALKMLIRRAVIAALEYEGYDSFEVKRAKALTANSGSVTPGIGGGTGVRKPPWIFPPIWRNWPRPPWLWSAPGPSPSWTWA